MNIIQKYNFFSLQIFSHTMTPKLRVLFYVFFFFLHVLTIFCKEIRKGEKHLLGKEVGGNIVLGTLLEASYPVFLHCCLKTNKTVLQQCTSMLTEKEMMMLLPFPNRVTKNLVTF